VPAIIVAFVLVAIGVLTVVAAIARLVSGSWASQFAGPARVVANYNWGADAVLAASTVILIVGLVLFIAGVMLGGHRSAQLSGPTGGQIEQTDYVITNRAIARLAVSRADLVDGVDTVSASATSRRVRLRISTTSEQADQIRDRVVRGVTDTLTAVGIDPPPQVSAAVRTKEI
jgi:hypothetical protein